MGLTWKDALSTVLAGGIIALLYAKVQGWTTWLTTPRVGVLALGVLGIAMCASGSSNVQKGGPAVMLLSVLGGLTLVLILLGLITGSVLYFYALAGTMLALWVLSTVRHAVSA